MINEASFGLKFFKKNIFTPVYDSNPFAT